MSQPSPVQVTPETVQAALDAAGPGTTIELQQGDYRERLRMTGRAGRRGRPIVIRGKKGAVLDGGRNVHQFNPVAHRLAEATQLNRGFPGMQAMMPQGHLVLDTCRYVRIEDLTIRGAWPTGIFIDNCQHVEIRNVHVTEGTFAFAAHGELTRNLSIIGCSWVQDLSEGSLWRRIGFEPVHGDFTLTGDWRAFDGDFFRAYRIRGDVLIQGNTVEHAFNGVHLFNREKGPRDDLNRRVVIRDNRFAYIRDNTIEPENAASDWWIVNNRFQDCYKLVSLEMERCGHVYMIGNRGWFTSMPGPEEDDHTSGELLKVGGAYDSWGPHYLLHNSWYLRGPLAKKKLPPGLVHKNNAILCCPGGRDWFCREEPPFLGPGVRPKGADWASKQISFGNDVVRQSQYPYGLIAKDYPVTGIGCDPKFADPGSGNFAIDAESPCWDRAAPVDLQLIDGTARPLHRPHVGAWQGAGEENDDPFGHLVPKAGADLGDGPGVATG